MLHKPQKDTFESTVVPQTAQETAKDSNLTSMVDGVQLLDLEVLVTHNSHAFWEVEVSSKSKRTEKEFKKGGVFSARMESGSAQGKRVCVSCSR